MSKFRIGIVGFSQPTKFDYVKAWGMVRKGLNVASSRGTGKELVVVGGLTDIPSIHQLAYMQARQNGWNCGGIACEKALNFKLFNMATDGDEAKIVGNHWGDENETFIDQIDILVRVGGGPQSYKVVQLAKASGIEVIEYDLDSING